MQNDTPPHIDLSTFWPYQVVALADKISRYTRHVVRTEADINQSQWRVLAAIADKPGRTAAEVTCVTPMDKTIVSRAVSSLIESGLIKKIPSQDDKRRASLQMTPLGLERYQVVSAKLQDTMIAQFSSGTSSESFVKKVKEFSERMDKITPRGEEPKKE